MNDAQIIYNALPPMPYTYAYKSFNITLKQVGCSSNMFLIFDLEATYRKQAITIPYGWWPMGFVLEAGEKPLAHIQAAIATELGKLV